MVEKEERKAECHPDRKHFAKGMCKLCYLRNYQREYYRNDSSNVKEKAAKRNAERYADPEIRKKILDYGNRSDVKLRRNELGRKRRSVPEVKAKLRELRITKEHGITREERDAILSKQEGLCPICKKELLDQEAVVDHDHKCCSGKKSCGKCVRGLLHISCNGTILRIAENNQFELNNAMLYLESQINQGE